jgi:LPXTG-site transpeptidase (sortase) family protein
MKLHWANRSLLLAIIVVNLYIISMPLVPSLTFWLQKHASHAKFKSLNHALHTSSPTIRDNRLIVPAMLFNQAVIEGKTMAALRQGPWHLPYTSTPDKGGNTVIIGHRFTYTNPRGTFYSLDKVRPGDEVGLFWQGKKYLYRVRESKVVVATARDVEAPTRDPVLTLYTCTPLWNPKNRLVVVADLEKTS